MWWWGCFVESKDGRLKERIERWDFRCRGERSVEEEGKGGCFSPHSLLQATDFFQFSIHHSLMNLSVLPTSVCVCLNERKV